MIERIIRFSIRNKIIIGLFVLALIGWGVYSLKKLPIDAVPDITNNQVQIISVAPTLAANEVEQFITAPIEVSVANIPDQVELRSISRLGLSVVTVVFKDDVDMYWARQQISERIKEAEENIPQGLTKPEMAPISTGLSEIYQYVLKPKPGYESKYDVMELRTIQDWIVRREMLGTPGVADVNSYGGYLKQYEISVNPDRLKAMNVSLNDIFDALEKNNQNTGSAYIDKKPNAYFIRGIGLVSSLEDISNIVVKRTDAGLPVLISDVAKVQYGSAPRYGAFIVDTMGESVGGVVMMLKGKNASEVIDGVKEKILLIEKSLPEGVELVPYYDRTDLVDRAVGTVSRNLIEGGLIVIFILVLMLGNLRAGLIVASVIPLSMLFAISLMNLFGISGNLMSLGAIDFGLIVDGAVIIVESVTHRISRGGHHPPGLTKLSYQQMDGEVLSSAKRMMNSATFGQIIILIVYLPILALVGIEGKMFRPMAETVSFAILGALILSLTYVPVASTLFLSRKTTYKKNISDRIMNFVHRIFRPLLDFSLRFRIPVVVASALMFIGSLFLFNNLGGEFIPQLEEGDLAAGVMTLQGGSLSNSVETVEKANKILMSKFPEVKHVVCKIGTGEIPTDPTPMETGDYIIVMKDKSEWTSAKTREEMMEKMQNELSVLKGVVFTLQQPIQMRFNELMTGSKQDVAVKIFGDNLETLTEKGKEIERLIRPVAGVEDINVESVTGSGQVQVIYDRTKLARYGLSIAEINRLLETAFAGRSAGVVYDEEKRFDMVVRYDKDYRNDIAFIKGLSVPLPDGGQVPLEQLANVELKTGIAQVSRESTKRRITVSFNVRGRDVESIIDEIRPMIDKKIKMPPGYFVTYGGQFENLVEARDRLFIAVPVALLLIFILLFFTFRSLKQTLLIFSAVPLSLIGGVIALYLRNMNFSISAGIGFIALFGVAVLNGIVLIAEFNRLEDEEGITDIIERVRRGFKARLRPVIMTATVASLGFLPMSISTSAGAEVQKPLATVVIGGLISATLLTLVVLPVLYVLFAGRSGRGRTKISKTALIALFAVGAGLLLTPSEASAQTVNPKPYTLEQALNRAMEANLYVQSADLNIDYQKKLRTSEFEFDKTNVDFEYGQSNSYQNDNSITISQSLPPFLSNVGKTKLGNAYVKSAQINLQLSRAEIASQVKETWVRLAYCYAYRKLLRSQDSLYTEFLKAATLRTNTGDASLLEKITVQSQAMELKTRVQQVSTDIDIFLNRLQILLNETNPVSISDTNGLRLNFTFMNDSAAFMTAPSLQLSQQEINISKASTRAETLNMMPGLSVGYFNRSDKDLSSSLRFTGVQFGISLPIISFSQAYKIKASKINEKISQTNYEYTRQSLAGEYQSLLSEYLKNKASVDYYENTALPQAFLIVSQAGLSYKSGDIGYMDYVLSLDRAMEIKSNYLQSLLSCNQSIVAIERLLGKAGQ
jgi:cobalt-zinc-cadmium resistance protein CzcA